MQLLRRNWVVVSALRVWSRLGVPPVTLTSLPVEVLILVFGHIDHTDALRLRRTCKYLEGVSRQKQVWSQLYLRLSDAYLFPLPYCDHLGSMSAEEIESATLKWERVGMGFMSESRSPRKHILHGDYDSRFHLVRGGRWFIACRRRGPVLAYDLDSPDEPPRELIPDMQAVAPENIESLAVYHPDTRPFSNFVLGFTHEDDRFRVCRFSLWNIGQLCGDSLSVTPLKSLAIRSAMSTTIFSFQENYLAVSVFNDQPFIEIYDWQCSSDHSHRKAALLVPECPWRIEFLPGDRILCLFENHLRIYALPSLNTVDPMTSVPPSQAATLWHLFFPNDVPIPRVRTPSVSSLRVTVSGQCSMLISPFDGVHLLTIPAEGAPFLTQILELRRWRHRTALGFYRGHTQSAFDGGHCLTFYRKGVKKCDDRRNVPKVYDRFLQPYFPLLDDFSGRLIAVFKSTSEFSFVDYLVPS